jgi:hypothetical protein
MMVQPSLFIQYSRDQIFYADEVKLKGDSDLRRILDDWSSPSHLMKVVRASRLFSFDQK